jgi:hypothetical protein
VSQKPLRPFFCFDKEYLKKIWGAKKKKNQREKKILLGNGALMWFEMHFHFFEAIIGLTRTDSLTQQLSVTLLLPYKLNYPVLVLLFH